MADAWDQFPDHPAADPWAAFPDHPAAAPAQPVAPTPHVRMRDGKPVPSRAVGSEIDSVNQGMQQENTGFENFALGATKTMANAGLGLYRAATALNPGVIAARKIAQAMGQPDPLGNIDTMHQNVAAGYQPDPNAIATKAGNVVGGTLASAPALASGPTGAAVLMGAQGAGENYNETHDVSQAAGSGAVSAAMAMLQAKVIAELAPKVGQAVAEQMAPGIVQKLLAGGATVGTDVAANAAAGYGGNVGQNLVAGRPLNEGGVEAAVTGAAQGLAFSPLSVRNALHPEGAPAPAAPVDRSEIPLAPVAEPSPIRTPAWDKGRPQVPDEILARPNADVVTWAQANGYDTAGMENLGRKPLMSALDAQRIQQDLPPSNEIARQSASTSPQLPPDSSGWDAGQLRRFANRNGYTIDQTRFSADVERGSSPRDAVRSQIEEQYGQQAGVGPTQGLENPEDVAARVLSRNRQGDTSSIPLTNTYRLAGEETEVAPPPAPPEPAPRRAITGTTVERPVSASAETPEPPTQYPRLPGETDEQWTERKALTISAKTEQELLDQLANNPPAPGGEALREPPAGTPLAQHINTVLGGETPEPAVAGPAADEKVVLDTQKQLSDLRSKLKAGELEGDAKTTAEKQVDGLAADVQNKLNDFGEKHGEDAGESLFEKIQQLMSDEGGSTTMYSTFANRKVIPAAKSVFGKARETWQNVNRFLGTGLAETPEESSMKGKVRAMTGDLDRQKAQTETRFRPARDVTEKWTQPDKDALVDQVESGAKITDPTVQKAADDLRKVNTQNQADAKAVGLDGADKWNLNYLGRLFSFPDGGPGGARSIAGREGYLKQREYPTYAEAKKAVEAQGGKPLYDNPIEMAVAKQVEIRKSIEARRLVKDATAAGTVVEMKPGMNLPDGYAYLDDKLAKRGGARLVAPEAVANTMNQMIASGLKKGIPLLDSVVALKRATAALNFSLSAWHLPIVSVRNAGVQVGLALNNALHGEGTLAARNLGRALPWRQADFGGQIRKAAASIGATGPLEPLIQAASEGGAKMSGRSMLTPTALEKVVRDYKAADPISAGGNLIHAIGETITNPIMEKFVPNVKAGYLASLAETYISRGLKGDDLAAKMRLASDNADNVLGEVVRSNQFQHRVAQDLMDVVFSAPKFAEGDIRSAGAFARDTARGIRDLATGKKPEITPAMQEFIGHSIVQATMGAAIQTAYTYATTGKIQYPQSVKDFFMPRTGRKNPDGSDERVVIPTGFSLFTSLATEGVKKTVTNRVSPLWRSLADVVQNSDYKNTQVYNPNAPILTQAGQVAKHVGKALLPFSVSNMVEPPTGEEQTTDLKVGGYLGVRKAAARLSQSPAEQMAHEFAYGNVPPKARTPEEEAKYGVKRDIEQGLRSKNPDVQGKIATAIKDGTLTRSEVADARKRANEPQGLVGLLKEGNLTSDQAVQVWDKATPEERKSIQWLVRGKIGRDEHLTNEQRQGFFKRLSKVTNE